MSIKKYCTHATHDFEFITESFTEEDDYRIDHYWCKRCGALKEKIYAGAEPTQTIRYTLDHCDKTRNKSK